MKSASLPKNEAERLESLKELKVLDTAMEKCYDEITWLASKICETPIALISLLDETRQWFKSRQGLDAESTDRELAFCAHAILEDEVFEIKDSREDERFSDNPLVTGAPNVIFYAGTQLKTPKDLNLGTLCVIDNKPRELNDFQKETLEILGRQVSNQFELRRNLFRIANAQVKETTLALAVSYGHEINNPLMIATSSLELFRKNQSEKNLVKVENSLKRIEEVVKSINETLKKGDIELDDYSGRIKSLKLK